MFTTNRGSCFPSNPNMDQQKPKEFDDYRPFTKQKINEMASNFLYSLD